MNYVRRMGKHADFIASHNFQLEQLYQFRMERAMNNIRQPIQNKEFKSFLFSLSLFLRLLFMNQQEAAHTIQSDL